MGSQTWPERLVCHRRRKGAGLVLALLFQVEIPTSVKIGRNLRLMHRGHGLVLHASTVIGDDVMIHQGVTVGRSDFHVVPAGTPETRGGVQIGDRVIVGANAVMLFRSNETLTIGNDAIIGAGAVVTRSVGPGEIWAGNPARRLGLARAGAEDG
jgi:serine O-acetyltransferase